MRQNERKKHHQNNNNMLNRIKAIISKVYSFANDNKMVYVIAATVLAIVVILVILFAQRHNNTTSEQIIEEVVQIGVDDDGNPVYETRKIIVAPSDNDELQETSDNPTILAYKNDARNGYMNNCIFLGDSRTVAAVSYGFLNDDMVLAQIGIAHMSVASNTFTQNSGKQYTLDSYLRSHQSPVVYINYGVNGMNGISEEDYEHSYEKLIDKIISLCPNSEIVLMGIWPVNDYGTYKGKVKNEWIDKYNAWLLSIAEEKNLHYLDVETILKGSNGQILPKYDAGDGLHYKSSAYNDIIDYIIHHPVPGISDDGDFVVHYIPPKGDFKEMMKEIPELPENAITESPTPTPEAEPIKDIECQHEYGRWNIEKEATTTSEGSKSRVCELCGHLDYDTIPMVVVTPSAKPTPTPSPEPSATPTPEIDDVNQPSSEPSDSSPDETSSTPDEQVPEVSEEPAPEPGEDSAKPAEDAN